ncbi:hypothetical protein [Streptomyces clavuligerus]|uniref:Uncharacterized protein n=2 Tax=Streptomyces clavuligerus TaxID=1901 RepID=B5GUK7_STRCL|nr:hypothetical protein [Streptomyces clavuligerus]EDY50003.1 hypothetical protein SSCG_03257 [Streptomyces clavuligerus]EFG03713.1 Hypothetical protein SCLAV_p0222 [Streptomyces clavuligerus]MBY6307742.1 hypothetical protein [Streptomyces clavuligerus]QPJ98243.1 hypothetical protein GE265_35165 [Streptomyces clavuligerus]WDN56418.1 hypothetical protein LL058_31750 [Streptomyces clavuligerus]
MAGGHLRQRPSGLPAGRRRTLVTVGGQVPHQAVEAGLELRLVAVAGAVTAAGVLLVLDVIDDTGLDPQGSTPLGGTALGRTRVEDRDKPMQPRSGRPPVPGPGLARRPPGRAEGVAIETGAQGPSPPEHPGHPFAQDVYDITHLRPAPDRLTLHLAEHSWIDVLDLLLPEPDDLDALLPVGEALAVAGVPGLRARPIHRGAELYRPGLAATVAVYVPPGDVPGLHRVLAERAHGPCSAPTGPPMRHCSRLRCQ